MKILSIFACYFEYGDKIGLTDVEQQQADKWLSQFSWPYISYAEESEYARCSITGLMGDCLAVEITERFTFQVCSIDVWGNSREGWGQNGYFRVGSISFGTAHPTNRQVLKALRDADILSELSKGKVTIHDYSQGQGNFNVVLRSNQKPLLSLMLERDWF